MYARGCWKHGRNSGSVGMPGLQKHLGKVWLKKTLEQSLCLFHHQWGAVGSSQVGSWWCRCGGVGCWDGDRCLPTAPDLPGEELDRSLFLFSSSLANKGSLRAFGCSLPPKCLCLCSPFPHHQFQHLCRQQHPLLERENMGKGQGLALCRLGGGLWRCPGLASQSLAKLGGVGGGGAALGSWSVLMVLGGTGWSWGQPVGRGEHKQGCRELAGRWRCWRDPGGGGTGWLGVPAPSQPHSSLRVLQRVPSPARGNGVLLLRLFGISPLLLWQAHAPQPGPAPTLAFTTCLNCVTLNQGLQ